MKTIFNATIITAIFLAAIILVPYVVPFVIKVAKASMGQDFKELGPIGDVIGGTTAPFIGLFSAILVYLSFQQQIKANKDLARQRHEDVLAQVSNSSLIRIEQKVDEFINPPIHKNQGIASLHNLIGILTQKAPLFKRVEYTIELHSSLAKTYRHHEGLNDVARLLLQVEQFVEFCSTGSSSALIRFNAKHLDTLLHYNLLDIFIKLKTVAPLYKGTNYEEAVGHIELIADKYFVLRSELEKLSTRPND